MDTTLALVAVESGVFGGASIPAFECFFCGMPGDGIQTEMIDVRRGKNISSAPPRKAIMNMQKSIIETVTATCAPQCAMVIVKLHGAIWEPLSEIPTHRRPFTCGNGRCARLSHRHMSPHMPSMNRNLAFDFSCGKNL